MANKRIKKKWNKKYDVGGSMPREIADSFGLKFPKIPWRAERYVRNEQSRRMQMVIQFPKDSFFGKNT